MLYPAHWPYLVCNLPDPDANIARPIACTEAPMQFDFCRVLVLMLLYAIDFTRPMTLGTPP